MKKFMTYSSQKGTKSNQIENKDKKSKTNKKPNNNNNNNKAQEKVPETSENLVL